MSRVSNLDSDPITPLLQSARLELLDLTARNRLLNTPRRSRFSSGFEIADELSSEIFRLLVRENRSFTFRPGKDFTKSTEPAMLEGLEWAALPQPEDEEADERGIPKRHSDTRLQTQLTSEALQRRLLTLYHDARTFVEEQGVNILYLALGMLRWYEAPSSDVERFAPIFLIPVVLERRSASERFALRWTGDDPLSNLTLSAKLKNDLGLLLPEAADLDDFDLDVYQSQIEQCIRGRARWEIRRNDITLGFFSFAKFLMYRDLDPATWPESAPLHKNPLICALLRDGFGSTESLLTDQEAQEAVQRLAADCFILDADSSQSLAIEEVRRGRNLVIQGPPGTGKSQTIANIIADSVRSGKRVLFVAEKMAALEVVKRRLDSLQLDGICLELHSNKANKRIVLEEIKRTLSLGHPVSNGESSVLSSLGDLRAGLEGHCRRIAAHIGQAGRSVFTSVGHLVKLSAAGMIVDDLVFQGAEHWTAGDVRDREALIKDLADQIDQYGVPATSPWRGVERRALLPIDIERIIGKIQKTYEILRRLTASLQSLSNAIGCPIPLTAEELPALLQRAEAIAAAPEMDRKAIGSESWNKLAQISELVEAGYELSNEKEYLSSQFTEEAWLIDLTSLRDTMGERVGSWFRWIFSDYRRAKSQLRKLLIQMPATDHEQLALLDRLMEARKLHHRVQMADDLGRTSFGSLWRGTESTWVSLRSILNWVEETDKTHSGLRLLLASLESTDAIHAQISVLRRDHETAETVLDDVASELLLSPFGAFERERLNQVPFNELEDRLQNWLTAREQLSKWIYISAARKNAFKKGLTDLVDRLWAGKLLPKMPSALFGSRTIPLCSDRRLNCTRSLAYLTAINTRVCSRHLRIWMKLLVRSLDFKRLRHIAGPCRGT